MNIRNYLEGIEAGGPGSGCHGPNCGRPKGHTGDHGPAVPSTHKSRKEAEVAQKKRTLKDVIDKYKLTETSKQFNMTTYNNPLGSLVVSDNANNWTFTTRDNVKFYGRVSEIKKLGRTLRDVEKYYERVDRRHPKIMPQRSINDPEKSKNMKYYEQQDRLDLYKKRLAEEKKQADISEMDRQRRVKKALLGR